MKDNKTKSVTEALVNSFGSSPIGYCVGIIILPISAGWLKEDPITATIMITMVYATVSFVRVYFLRRFFEKFGFNDNIIRVGVSFCKKLNHGLKIT